MFRAGEQLAIDGLSGRQELSEPKKGPSLNGVSEEQFEATRQRLVAERLAPTETAQQIIPKVGLVAINGTETGTSS